MTSRPAKRHRRLSWHAQFMKRPAMYIGGVEGRVCARWVFDGTGMVYQEDLVLSDGLNKLLDEVVQNACDAQGVGHVRVRVTASTVTVCNDGDTLPFGFVEEGDGGQPGQRIPEMVFSEFGSGSNFDDDDTAAGASGGGPREGAGMNGIGVKAVGAMSNSLLLVCWNGHQTYSQRFEDRLAKVHPCIIEPNATRQWSTIVSFKPLLPLFTGIHSLDDHFARAAYARLIKASAYLQGVRFVFQGKPITQRNVVQYAECFGCVAPVHVHTPEFDVAVALSPREGECVVESSVAAIDTFEGGTHVDCALAAISTVLATRVQARTKVRPTDHAVRSRLFVACFFRTVNPQFSSQTKARLTSPIPAAAKAGLKAAIEALAAKHKFADVEEELVRRVQAQQDSLAARTLGGAGRKKHVQVKGLRDATRAGRSQDALLFVVEGESAMSMAVGGIDSMQGQDAYGALAMRGKPKNVAGESLAMTLEMESVRDVAQALGLKLPPFDLRKLRYGRGVSVMADQDDHGSHICALMLQMMREYWPEMLHQGKVWRFVTPLVKVFRSAAHQERGEHVEMFFDEDSFNDWRGAHWKTGMCARYYKGLGSHDPQEVQAYFRHLGVHLKRLTYDEAGEALLKVAFADSAAVRRAWLGAPAQVSRIDYSKPTIPVSALMDVDYRRFANSQNENLLPGLDDGLKRVQQKIVSVALVSCQTPKKVPEVAGLLASQAQYHHGDTSAKNAVLRMAMSWPGSNNLPLLTALGHVGSRRGTKDGPGKDAADPRYVSVRLAPLATNVFVPADAPILRARVIDGIEAEPETYFPTLPLALVNGVRSIGVGYASKVPCFSVPAILDALERRCRGQAPKWPDTPYYHGFTGTFVPRTGSGGGWVCRGAFTLDTGGMLRITEVPIGKSLVAYAHQVLDKLEVDGKVSGVKNLSKNNHPEFTCRISEGFEPTYATLKLESIVPLDLNVLDGTRVCHFESVGAYLDVWYDRKMAAMRRRKAWVEADMQRRKRVLEAELAFFELVNQDVVRPRDMNRAQMRNVLRQKGLDEWAGEFLQKPLSVFATDSLREKRAAYEAFCKECVTYAATPAEELYVRDITALRTKWREEAKRVDARNAA